jgi:hypothetical protein
MTGYSSLTDEFITQHGVTFFFPLGKYDNNHCISCLASGLRQLGIPVFSNIHHPDFTFKAFEDFDLGVFVFLVTEDIARTSYLKDVLAYPKTNKFVLSMADVTNTLAIPKGLNSFMTHELESVQYINPRYPWAFGIHPNSIEQLKDPLPVSSRRMTILRNFRPSYQQTVRDSLDFSLIPLLEKYFNIDRVLDGSNHFHRLKNYVGCAAYGGGFYSNHHSRADYQSNDTFQIAFEQVAKINGDAFIGRWDSYRLWESFASGNLTLMLDFKKYGFILPVIPTPWVHYIPIDLSDPKCTVERLMDMKTSWDQIGYEGRRWALTYYSPLAVAQRFVSAVKSHNE